MPHSPELIHTLNGTAEILAKLSRQEIRPFSTRDFGREQYPDARSVIVPANEAEPLLAAFRPLLGPGLLAFIGTMRNLAKPRVTGAELVLGIGLNQFEILRIAQSDAVNYDQGTEDLIAELQAWDDAYGIDIFHAETDTIRLRLKRRPENMLKFAEDVYSFCPDIVDQGCGSVEALAEEIRKTEMVYLWWD